MSERRWDPTTGEWVTFATHRQDRVFLPAAGDCPLCPTPAGAQVRGEVARPAYDVVVFDNRFPAMSPEPPAPDAVASALLPVAPAGGRCEVLVYSSDHGATLARAGLGTVRLLVDVWADRYRVLGGEGHAYVLPFENKGEVIGVTLHHPHGQVYAFPQLPPRPARELAAAALHRRRTGRCVECDVVEGELVDGRRLVAVGEHWVAHVPFWARFPYEVRLSPRRHAPSLLEVDGEGRDDLASVLQQVLTGYDALWGTSLPYVLGVFSRPTGGDPAQVGWDGDWDDIAHVHLDICPPGRSPVKLKHLAGAELMGGAFMTDIAPEAAAASLREAVARALLPAG